MANKARMDSPDGKSVKALDADSKEHIFYCDNIGCDARMHLCKEGTDSPYFSSYKRMDHKYPFCTDGNLTFHPDKYSEDKFNLKEAIQQICYKRDNDIHGGEGGFRKKSEIGNNKKIGIKTAKGIFAMCEYVGCGKTYNGVEINSIYLCQENRSLYKTSLDGFCVVKASYKRKEKNSSVIKFSIKISEDSYVFLGATFKDEHMAWDFYNRIKKHQEFKSLTYVIVAEWEKSSDDSYDYICSIRKLSQIFFIYNE